MKKSTSHVIGALPMLINYLPVTAEAYQEVVNSKRLDDNSFVLFKLVCFFEDPKTYDFHMQDLYENLSGDWLPVALEALNIFFEKDTFLIPKQNHSLTKESLVATKFKALADNYLTQKDFVDFLNTHGENYTEAKFSVYVSRNKVPTPDLVISGTRYWLKTTCEEYLHSLKSLNMKNKDLDVLTDEVVRLYQEDKELEEIARLCSVPEYLVASILSTQKNIYFR